MLPEIIVALMLYGVIFLHNNVTTMTSVHIVEQQYIPKSGVTVAERGDIQTDMDMFFADAKNCRTPEKFFVLFIRTLLTFYCNLK
jgi:hypothetical protein